MPSKRTDFIIKLLKFGGHWLNFSDTRNGRYLKYFQIFRHVYLLLGWYLNFSLVFNCGVSFLLTPTAAFVPLCYNVILTTGILFFTIPHIEGLILESENNLSSYKEDWEKEIIESDTKMVRRIADLLNYGMNFFGLAYLIGPLFVDCVRSWLGYDEPYMVPLPLDTYYTHEKSRTPKMYLTLAFTLVWFFFALPNTASFETLIFHVISYTTTEIKILKKRLRMLYDTNDTGVELMKDWDLRDIIQKHQQIVKLNNLQRKHITLPYIVQRVVSTFSICFIMFLVSQMVGKDSVIVVMGGLFILMLMGVIYIMCFSSEYLQRMSEELFYEASNTPWYRQSSKVRKDFIFMLMEANRSLVLDYKCHFPLSLQAFMQIINASYSYYMLLKSFS